MRVEVEAVPTAATSPLRSPRFLDDTTETVSERFESLTLSPRRPAKLRPVWTRYQRPRDWLEGMPRAGFVYDATMLAHSQLGHVERPGRILVPFQRLRRNGALQRCFQLDSRRASTSELRLFHTEQHIRDVYEGRVDEEDDLYWCQDATAKSAVFSVGCTLQAMESVLHGALDRAFALVRPPGHHAEQCAGQGFCFFNNVAIAAKKAMASPSLCRRVLIVDWDAHHGNGTQNGFYTDPNVMYISLHRGGEFYPGTGAVSEIGHEDGYGYNVNIPWPRGGFGDADYLAAFECVLEPLIEAFQPDLTLVSAGFDAVEHDPLGGLAVTPLGFAHMTERLLKLNSKTVLVLEGGYNLLQLSSCVQECVGVLLGETPKRLGALKLQPETEGLLMRVAQNLSLVWPVLEKHRVEERLNAFKRCYLLS